MSNFINNLSHQAANAVGIGHRSASQQHAVNQQSNHYQPSPYGAAQSPPAAYSVAPQYHFPPNPHPQAGSPHSPPAGPPPPLFNPVQPAPYHAQPSYAPSYPNAPGGGSGSSAPPVFNSMNSVPPVPTCTNHPLPFIHEAQQHNAFERMAPKSLVFCLALDNPFDMKDTDKRIVGEELLDGPWETRPDGSRMRSAFPFLADDELLMKHVEAGKEGPGSPGSNGIGVPLLGHFVPTLDSPLTRRGNGTAPNKFQKVMELIFRLYKRGIDIYPNDMIAPVADVHSAKHTSPNYFHGYTLVHDKLLLSPDLDEMYIKVHVSKSTMLQFAEEQGVFLPTNPYSFAGGAPMSYSAKMDKKLCESVVLFLDAFPDDCKGLDMQEGGSDGFLLDVPDKMRIVTRFMRESWQFGGCGIQIDEMKRNQVLVRHFFPLHNVPYQQAYALDKWASFAPMFTTAPLEQDENSIRKYFGEEIALYFGWMVTYTKFLRFIAVAGVAFGIISAVGENHEYVKQEVAPVSNALFSLYCVIWGLVWNFRSLRYENLFAIRYGQEAQLTQELVRDEFEKDMEQPLTVEDLYRLRFDVPLTLKIRGDGSLIDLHYSARKRMIARYLVAYPAVVALTAAMVTLQLLITEWRLSDCETSTSTLSSMCSVIVSVGFGIIFDKLVPILNRLENNRTDTEEAYQTISKSFFFCFFSNYFALFAIALYPRDNTFTCVDGEKISLTFNTTAGTGTIKVDDAFSGIDRLDEIMFQMLFATVVKPMVQNAVELILPMVKAKLRVRNDMQRAEKAAKIATMVNHAARSDVVGIAHPRQGEATAVWLEAQMEPYESTSGDYLEITLQYGFMTMFAATFPWAAVAALLYNILEIRLDAVKLLRFSQRPVARPAAGIGAWRSIQFFLCALSVISNGYLVAVMSPFAYNIKLGSDAGMRYKVFVVAQYVVLACFYIVFTTYAGPSPKSERLRVKHALVSNHASRTKMMEDLKNVQRQRSGVFEDPSLGGASNEQEELLL